MMDGYVCTPLQKAHDRTGFTCGVPALDDFLRLRARQQTPDHGATFVLTTESDPADVLGFYTLASHSVDAGQMSTAIRKKFPYQYVSVTLLGRLAVATKAQGGGLGEHLLMDALFRGLSARSEIGAWAVVVDPKDAKAAAFYARYDFVRFGDGDRMVLPYATIEKLFV